MPTKAELVILFRDRKIMIQALKKENLMLEKVIKHNAKMEKINTSVIVEHIKIIKNLKKEIEELKKDNENREAYCSQALKINAENGVKYENQKEWFGEAISRLEALNEENKKLKAELAGLPIALAVLENPEEEGETKSNAQNNDRPSLKAFLEELNQHK